MTLPRWFSRPDGPGLLLRQQPRLASWNKAADPDQIRLRDYLSDTADLLGPPADPTEPWALRLDVGLPPGRNLIDMADLDNYAYPLARHLDNRLLVSVWCTKRHHPNSFVHRTPAREVAPPPRTWRTRTTASAGSTSYKEQVRAAVADASPIPPGPVRLQISFTVGPRRNWLNLWKPTIDALDPLLGRTRPDRDWHPQDGRITELALHLTTDDALEHDVGIDIHAAPATGT